jgi:hypothetical protein
MAKSEIRTIHVWWTVENSVFQHTGGRENDFAISITFGECQVMAQPVARRLLVPPLINRDFRGCYLTRARGNLASANLNHQHWPRAIKRSNPYRRFADTPGSGAMNVGREHAPESMIVGRAGCSIASRASN